MTSALLAYSSVRMLTHVCVTYDDRCRELKRVKDEEGSRLQCGTVLSKRYLLQRLLGKGGFSEVFQVETPTKLDITASAAASKPILGMRLKGFAITFFCCRPHGSSQTAACQACMMLARCRHMSRPFLSSGSFQGCAATLAAKETSAFCAVQILRLV